MSKRDNIIKEKTLDYALRIIKMYQFLKDEQKEYVISKQLLRSGTAIGAMVHESEYAESKLDFVHKLAIGLKEANETKYWITLLYRSEYISEDAFNSIVNDTVEIIKLLTTIINNTKKSIK